MGAELFSRMYLRFEIARDCIGAVLAHQMAVIAEEASRDDADQGVLAQAEEERAKLMIIRDDIDPANSQQIESIIRDYGQLALKLFRGM